MNYYKVFTVAGLLILIVAFSQCRSPIAIAPPPTAANIEDLGRNIFLDTSLSNPGGQACATCHDSATAFSAPHHDIVTPGIVPGLTGNRNAPSIAYSKFFPSMYWSSDDTSFVGGQFLDGRVNTLEEQAQAPFLNPLEMANGTREMVIEKIRKAPYFSEFQ